MITGSFKPLHWFSFKPPWTGSDLQKLVYFVVGHCAAAISLIWIQTTLWGSRGLSEVWKHHKYSFWENPAQTGSIEQTDLYPANAIRLRVGKGTPILHVCQTPIRSMWLAWRPPAVSNLVVPPGAVGLHWAAQQWLAIQLTARKNSSQAFRVCWLKCVAHGRKAGKTEIYNIGLI